MNIVVVVCGVVFFVCCYFWFVFELYYEVLNVIYNLEDWIKLVFS